MSARATFRALAVSVLLVLSVAPGCSPQRGFEPQEQTQAGTRPTRSEAARPAEEKSGPSRGVIILGLITAVVTVPVLLLVLL